MNTTLPMQKREIPIREKRGLSVSDILLIGVLLAAGAVLKFFVGSMFSAGMKPNFIIAMYCLIILLIKPRLHEAIIIGVLAGAICQFFPGTPYINLLSEPVGAIVVMLLAKLPLRIKKVSLSPIIGTFLGTMASGMTFIGLMYLLFYSGADVVPTPLGVFFAIILGTAVVNTIIVELLYIPLCHALKK